MQTQINILGIFEKQRIKLEIAVIFLKKKHFFYTLRQQHFFISFCSFEGVRYFWVELCIFFSKLLSATNQPTVILRHWKQYRTGTFKPYSTPLWTIGFSTVTCIKLWQSVKGLQKNALKI